MDSRRGYHHGDLRAALVQAARDAIAAAGPDAVSLREIAQTLGVSRAAPYRHFADRRALLAEVAAQGFEDLTTAYARAIAAGPTPRAALRQTARVYLGLAFERPGLFRLMFDSDILGPDAPASLTEPAGEAWALLYQAVAAVDPTVGDVAVKRRVITGWSTLQGFVTLKQAGRLRAFMTEPLSESDLI
ncbi:MAG: TetR/AcrR family transcriptional regulator, partial [Phenylobacterium sp.]